MRAPGPSAIALVTFMTDSPDGEAKLKVVLGTFKDKGEELAAFLEPRVGAKPALAGDSIEIDDGSVREGVKPRQVKTYIKRFLFMNKVRKKYRVFVAGKELTIQEIELGEEEEKEEPAKKAAEEKPAGPEAGAEAEAPAEGEPNPPEEKKAKKAPARKPRASKKKGA
jgi:hypothetical protein